MSDEVKHPEEETTGAHIMLTPKNVLTRAKDDWCATCSKPSKLEGPLLYLCSCGVGPWGTVMGCPECKQWSFINSKGEQLQDVVLID